MNIWPRSVTDVDEVLHDLPGHDGALLRWQESLDLLQRAAEAALGLLVNPLTSETHIHSNASWAPPADLGPLPEILQERALNLAALQQQAVDMLTTSRAGVEHEMAELARPRRQVQPVYVDVTG